MATGDTNDVVARLRATLPPWFPDLNTAPILNAILTGIAGAFSFCYQYLSFAALQTRINTATGGWLDLIAWDFFGVRFMRRSNETDASFQPRILQEIIRPRQTRAAIIEMLDDLTGNVPEVFEAFNTNDFGCYDVGTMGYGCGLGYGSTSYPNQVFINAFLPAGQGIPSIAGYGSYLGGYNVGSLAYIDLSQIQGPVTDAEVYERIADTVAAGIIPWTALRTGPAIPTHIPEMIFNTPINSQVFPLLPWYF